MKWLEKTAITVGPFGVLLILVFSLILSSYVVDWWANTPPRRPKGVPANAVWIWAPHVGFPRAPRGDWLYCWVEKNTNQNRCRLIEKDGVLHYEGDFVLYNQPNMLVPEEQLIIDPKKTYDYGVGIGLNEIPLVHLKNGFILIPKESAEKATRILQEASKSSGK